MLRRVRVLQTDHLVADGANDPLCFEIRNLEQQYSARHEENWVHVSALLQAVEEEKKRNSTAFAISLTQHFNNVVAWAYFKRALHASLADDGVLRCAVAPRDVSAEEAQAFCDVCHLGPYYSRKGDRSLDNPL
ncbi:hypothetical protein WA577_002950, partial [Blastocystis sp. JDR]